MKSPKRTAKTTVNPSEDWLSSTFRYLGMDPHARQVAEAVQQSATEWGYLPYRDPIEMLARIQAITNMSLQQVAQGLFH